MTKCVTDQAGRFRLHRRVERVDGEQARECTEQMQRARNLKSETQSRPDRFRLAACGQRCHVASDTLKIEGTEQRHGGRG